MVAHEHTAACSTSAARALTTNTIRVVRVGPTVTVSLRGDLDLMTVGDAREHLRDVLVEGELSHLWLDLSRVTFIDSTGVGLLVWAMKQARMFRVELELVEPSAEIIPVLGVLGIDRIIPVRRSGDR
jgi:anti-sigma B factor antagonist